MIDPGAFRRFCVAFAAAALGLTLLALMPGCDRPLPPPAPTPSPSPGPTPPPSKAVELGISGHWLTDHGRPLLISSYGNVVTAIPGHDWRSDVALSVERGLPYNRLWHILAHATPDDAWPWKRLGNGRWQLLEPNNVKYWPLIDEVLRATRDAGLILEPHIFDRGCGGSQDEYKAYPWHPANNVNNLRLPTGGSGTPAFYQEGNHRPLQADYVEWWVDAVKPYRHVLLEIENENRGEAVAWAKHWSQFIKARAPQVLLSFSTLDDSNWERAMRLPGIDVPLIHMNRECRDDLPCIRSLAQKCWTFGKPCIFDEWANGEGNIQRLRRTAWTLATAGASSHIEDARAGANPFAVTDAFTAAALGASGSVRWFVEQSGWRFWEAAPKGPCMVSAAESVCQSEKGERVPMRNREFRWYDPRSGGFTGWTATAEPWVVPPSQDDWILQTR